MKHEILLHLILERETDHTSTLKKSKQSNLPDLQGARKRHLTHRFVEAESTL